MAKKRKKRWIASGSKNSRHERLSGETVDLFKPFSNGLQYPGDHRGAEIEWANCQCHMEIIEVEVEGESSPDFGAQEDLEDQFDALNDTLSVDDIDAFVGEDGYLDNGWLYNSYLREGENIPAYAQEQIALLDKMMQPLKKSYVTYRGIGEDFEDLFGHPPKAGGIISDKGFSSTSINPKIAEDFKESGFMLEIEAAKGSGGLWVDSILGLGEKELLLSRNAKFQITEVVSKSYIKVRVVE